METITFYSYKGGTGRTLAVANTAIFLAEQGQDVFVLDFDLEAPGLHYKLPISHEGGQESCHGLVDWIYDIRTANLIPGLKESQYVHRVNNPRLGSDGGLIWLMPAGNAPSSEYSRKYASIDLPALFNPDEKASWDIPVSSTICPHCSQEVPPPASLPLANLGVPLFSHLKRQIEKEYAPQFLLIDSRTGVTEIGGVALRVLADSVVCLVHSNPENIAGARKVLLNLRTAHKPPTVVVALARIPEGGLANEEALLAETEHKFNEVVDGASLGLKNILPLHSDPDLQLAEALRIGTGTTANESALLRDYFKLFDRLGFGNVLSSQSAEVLRELALADRRPKSRALLLGGRQATSGSAEPIRMMKRFQSAASADLSETAITMKVVLPDYLKSANYEAFIKLVTRRIGHFLRIEKSAPLRKKDVRWDLLGIHLREGVIDFCEDLYYLTENRSHLVDIVQLGRCSKFVAYARADSILETDWPLSASDSFEDSMKALLGKYPKIAFGVLGDTPAASEANRRLSRHLKPPQLISKGNEKDLFLWLQGSKGPTAPRVSICDWVVAHRLEVLARRRNTHYRTAVFKFSPAIPIGIVYPREDREWRKCLARAIAYGLVEFIERARANGTVGAWRLVDADFKQNGIDALSLHELRTSLLMDLPFKEAVEWDSKFRPLVSSEE